ncbi:glycosyl transferase [Trypanosoma grayi]|uniref:glycosyl transferase n=1 Tax=Trypanosoma grayi TaxID=71804 RepID=UPI0004F4488B|nr:glycosyl transferase [Trypanosoma grayi]KEG07558.1 glycosyl transferase [Trypanosoma grayi]
MRRVVRRRRRPLLLLAFITVAVAWVLLVYAAVSLVEPRVAVTVVHGPVRSDQAPQEEGGPSRESVLQRLVASGYRRETKFNFDRRSEWRRPEGSCAMAAVGVPQIPQRLHAPIAYLTCISNEEFVDGALVLGVSLRKTSSFLQEGVADLVVIITEKRVSEASKRRLLREGTYNHVFEVPSLAYRIPSNSGIFRDTFDKIYMFNLTMYEKVVFMDADMIAVRSMDKLFSKPEVQRPDHVGAIGGKGYFQTGMMVIVPTQEMFNCIYETFIHGTPPDGRKYLGSGARDGVLLRDVFERRYHPISSKYSRNLNPRYRLDRESPGEDPIVAVHLRGIVKPWFNRHLPNLHTALGKKEYGFTYLHWWTLYEEEVHKKGEYYMKAQEMQREGIVSGAHPVVLDNVTFGGNQSTEGGSFISPLTHVWMQRYCERAYVQHLSSEDKKRRNRTLPFMRKIPSPSFGLSCEAVCSQAGLRCSPEALQFSSLNNCEELRSVFGCDDCELGVYWRPHPGNDFPALEEVTENTSTGGKNRNTMGGLICRYNYLHDARSLPNCSASYPKTRRYCPCVPAA